MSRSSCSSTCSGSQQDETAKVLERVQEEEEEGGGGEGDADTQKFLSSTEAADEIIVMSSSSSSLSLALPSSSLSSALSSASSQEYEIPIKAQDDHSDTRSPNVVNQEHQYVITINNNSHNNNNSSGSFDNDDDDDYVELPGNVTTHEQLSLLPSKYRSGDPARPLQHVVDKKQGIIHKYALNPMFHSVMFILLVELLERFSFYGVSYTMISFLTGAYNHNWNVGMTAVQASSYVSASTAVAYTAPFVGALLADGILGDYYVILVGATLLYLPGSLLIALTTVPHLLGDTFNTRALSAALLVLYPVGAGVIKSVVNVFGAKQHHPILQSTLIETYYVNFYMSINIGATVGGILIPIVARYNISIAYFLPVIALGIGIGLFVLGTPRYVRDTPVFLQNAFHKLFFLQENKKNNTNIVPKNDEKEQVSLTESSTTTTNTENNNTHRTNDEPANIPLNGTIAAIPTTTPSSSSSPSSSNTVISISIQNKKNLQQLFTVARVSSLVVPFCVVYSQMATTFIVQGTVMQPALDNLFDPATMNNLDAVSVLFFGYIIGSYFYPFMAKLNIKIPTSYKFAAGSFLGVLSILCAILVERRIHYVYAHGGGERISILWQTFSYVLIGAGEIFALSAAYEVAFMVAPVTQKALASALNLFFTGGVPSFICIGLFELCKKWFENSSGTADIRTLEHYVEANVGKYFWVLLGIAVFGTILNVLPCVRDWIERVEQEAYAAEDADGSGDPSSAAAATDAAAARLRKKLKALEGDDDDDNVEFNPDDVESGKRLRRQFTELTARLSIMSEQSMFYDDDERSSLVVTDGEVVFPSLGSKRVSLMSDDASSSYLHQPPQESQQQQDQVQVQLGGGAYNDDEEERPSLPSSSSASDGGEHHRDDDDDVMESTPLFRKMESSAMSYGGVSSSSDS